VHTVVVTATPIPVTSTPTYAPAAKLIRNSPAGKCRWICLYGTDRLRTQQQHHRQFQL
jgi:hypothetical protein